MRAALSPVALSRLTWTADDRKAWEDTYRACLLVAERGERAREGAVPLAVNVAVKNGRGPRIVEARRYSIHADNYGKES